MAFLYRPACIRLILRLFCCTQILCGCGSSWGEFWVTENPFRVVGELPAYVISNTVTPSTTNYPYKIPVTGGEPPYTITVDGSGLNTSYGLTPQIINGDTLSLGAIIPDFFPATVSASNAGSLSAGFLNIKITDSVGKISQGSFSLQLQGKRAFVMSTPLSPTGLGPLPASCSGLTTAVAKVNCVCQVLAASASPPLPNPQKFRGWISIASPVIHARCNVANQADNCAGVQAAAGGPWYTTSGLMVARDMSTTPGSGLLGGSILTSINRTESNASQAAGQPGNYAGYPSVWTGSTAAGVSESTCTNWTGVNPGTIATQTATTGDWSSTTSGGTCGASFPFYCFEGDQ